MRTPIRTSADQRISQLGRSVRQLYCFSEEDSMSRGVSARIAITCGWAKAHHAGQHWWRGTLQLQAPPLPRPLTLPGRQH